MLAAGSRSGPTVTLVRGDHEDGWFLKLHEGLSGQRIRARRAEWSFSDSQIARRPSSLVEIDPSGRRARFYVSASRGGPVQRPSRIRMILISPVDRFWACQASL